MGTSLNYLKKVMQNKKRLKNKNKKLHLLSASLIIKRTSSSVTDKFSEVTQFIKIFKGFGGFLRPKMDLESQEFYFIESKKLKENNGI